MKTGNLDLKRNGNADADQKCAGRFDESRNAYLIRNGKADVEMEKCAGGLMRREMHI